MTLVMAKIGVPSESGKARRATVEATPKRMAASLAAGISTHEVWVPGSAIQKDDAGNPKLDGDGNALVEGYAFAGKIKGAADGLLFGKPARLLHERAVAANDAGAYALVREASHNRIKCVAESPATPEGAAYLGRLARTHDADVYRIMKTEKPVAWQSDAERIDGKPVVIDALPIGDLPAHTLHTVDELAPKKAKQPEPEPEAPAADAQADAEDAMAADIAAQAAAQAGHGAENTAHM